jgi:hypothetical protein
MIRQHDGTIVGATKKTRDISRRVRRMLRSRDQGCRFPGCGQRQFVDAHHIHHRAHGGTHELDNLVELCWFHHRLVHGDGWTIRFDDCGHVVVTNPAGNVIPSRRGMAGAVRALPQQSDRPMARWHGDPLDLDHIITALWCIDQRSSRERSDPRSN